MGGGQTMIAPITSGGGAPSFHGLSPNHLVVGDLNPTSWEGDFRLRLASERAWGLLDPHLGSFHRCLRHLLQAHFL